MSNVLCFRESQVISQEILFFTIFEKLVAHPTDVVMATAAFSSYLKKTTCDHYKDPLVGLTLSWKSENYLPQRKRNPCPLER
jgi:hypothetical protein